MQEKVACFKQLGVDSKLLPKRIYAGRANGRIRNFHIKMPVAVEQDRAIFAYIDPGMSTRSPLHCWDQAHRRLWEKLRKSGRRVEVVAVAWEPKLLDRAGRQLQSWVARKMSEGEKEALMLRQAIADTDWDTVERYGGLNAALKKINQLTAGNAGTQGPGNDRRLPPLGVTPMPSYSCATEKGGVAHLGGARF